jgi:hypothetical protein
MLSFTKVMIDEQASKSHSYVRDLEGKMNTEFNKLHQSIIDLSHRFYQLQSTVHSPANSPTSHSRPQSTHHSFHPHSDRHLSTTPKCILHPYEACASPPAPSTLNHHPDTLPATDQIRYLQDALNTALERHAHELNYLRKENEELRYSRSISNQTPPNVLPSPIHTKSTPSRTSHTSAFIPIITSSKPQSNVLPTHSFPSTSIMPFTMSLTNTLPNFSGKETEMPIKFITEFEIRASGLVGYNDDYLLRAVQQALSDSALTWFALIQQEQPIHTWTKFKELFIRRFRTPEKIELLRGRLRTLWQGDNESTADYFERLKALMSEIEPATSTDYIKRKFLQKLRKDIRDRITLGLTSSLSHLVQKAIEIESNIVQQKIDDKLRDTHKEDNNIKQKSTTVNNLFSSSRSNPSSLRTYNEPSAYDNYTDNSKNTNHPQRSFENKSSRTFTNSSQSSPRATPSHSAFSGDRSLIHRNVKTQRRNHNRWCSFCSSTGHTWSYCYSNPNSSTYRPEYYQSLPQPQPQQQQNHQHLDPPFTSASDSSQQPYSDRQPHYPPPKPNELLHQNHHHQRSEPPSSSSYLPSQRSSMPGNVQGSQF